MIQRWNSRQNYSFSAHFVFGALLLCLMTPGMPCRADSVLIPRVDSPTDNALTFGSGEGRVQQVIDANQLADLMPEGAWITGVALNDLGFRLPGPVRTVQMDLVEVAASTTIKEAGDLDKVFSRNIGPDVTSVFSGSNVVWRLQDGGALDAVIPFDQPFLFEPKKGNLLFDFRIANQKVGQTVDFTTTSSVDDGTSMLFTDSPFLDVDSTTHSAMKMRIDFVVIPEPSTLRLGVCAGFFGAVLLICRRRRESS